MYCGSNATQRAETRGGRGGCEHAVARRVGDGIHRADYCRTVFYSITCISDYPCRWPSRSTAHAARCLCECPTEKPVDTSNCAHCKGRLWVPKDAAADETPVETVTISAGSSQSVVSMEPPKSPLNLPVRGVQSAVTPLSVQAIPTPLVPVQPPVTRNKVARFIAAEAAGLNFEVGRRWQAARVASGRRLCRAEGGTEPAIGQTPLVMVGVLTISVVLSIVLALVDVDSSPVSGSKKKGPRCGQRDSRTIILAWETSTAKRLEPYQIRAPRGSPGRTVAVTTKPSGRGYRKVLDMLRAEAAAATNAD